MREEIPVQSQEIYSPPPAESSKRSFPWKFPVIYAVILLVFGAGFGAAYFIFGTKKPDIKPQTVNREPSRKTFPSKIAEEKQSLTIRYYDFVYLKDSNIYSYSMKDKKEVQLTSDAGEGVSYRMPKWVGGRNEISYIRCVTPIADGPVPTTCSIDVRNIETGSVKTVVSRTSQKNEKGFYNGGSIMLYGWDPKGEKLAYLSDSYTSSEYGSEDINLVNTKTNESSLLSTFKLGGGRGGGLDDDSDIAFSPDGSKFFLMNTGFYPGSLYVGNDDGTLMVYGVSSKGVLYKKNQTWSAFSHWVDNKYIIVRQQPYSKDFGGGTPIVAKIDTDSGQTEPIMTVGNNDVGFEPSGKEGMVFFTQNRPPLKGLTMKKLDLSTKNIDVIQENLYPFKALGEGKVLVRTMVACSDGENTETMCGMDVYNGFIQDKFGIWDGKNIEAVNIPGVKPFNIRDVDVRVE